MIHFVKTKNLPYSVKDVRKMIAACRVCSEVKPRFHKPPGVSLVKATQPFERLSLDFKGPLPSSSKNKYILMVIDEISRSPFAFPCANMESKSVIQCLTNLFPFSECVPVFIQIMQCSLLLVSFLIFFINLEFLWVALQYILLAAKDRPRDTMG